MQFVKQSLQDPILLPRTPNVSNRQLLWNKSCSFYGSRAEPIISARPYYSSLDCPPNAVSSGFTDFFLQWTMYIFQQTNEVSSTMKFLSGVNATCSKLGGQN